MRLLFSYCRTVLLLLFILLFVYAAVSKLIGFSNFPIQISQSPLLSVFATPIADGVVIGELLIAFILCFTRSRLIGLYLFLGFMTAFTVYIYLILNYSPFVPCSCGGILEKMGWTEHLWFNIITSIVAAAILLHKNTTKQIILYTAITIITSTAAVVLLFITSEHIMKRGNPFVRRFLPHHIDNSKYLDLEYNSYYIAGLTKDTIYLGNYTAPLLITAVPKNLEAKVEHVIKLDETNRSFRSLTVRVHEQDFFVSDGTVPIIYKGN